MAPYNGRNNERRSAASKAWLEKWPYVLEGRFFLGLLVNLPTRRKELYSSKHRRILHSQSKDGLSIVEMKFL